MRMRYFYALYNSESDKAVKMEIQGLEVHNIQIGTGRYDWCMQSGNMEMEMENVMVKRLKFNQTDTDTQQPTRSIAPHQSQRHV